METPIIKCRNEEEFQMMINNQDFEISKLIVKSILKNLDTEEDDINVLSIELFEENEIQDIWVKKEDFAQTLEENLKHFEKQEMYEECAIIKKTIDLLNKK